jgi:hypothetical protein
MFVALGVGASGLYWSFPVLALVSLTWLGTRALSPGANPLLYWPLGLLVSLVVLFPGYVVLWKFPEAELTQAFARWGIGLGGVCLAVSAVLRVFHTPELPVLESRASRQFAHRTAVQLVACLPAATLLILSALRYLAKDQGLFSSHMSGGDHGLHNELVHNMLSWSGTRSFENPFNLYTYPRGVHFFVALLTSLGSAAPVNPLKHEYLTAAWFEHVQLAAYVQLSVTMLVKWRGSGQLGRATFVPPLLMAVASAGLFVPQLFWSGFTTSLAMSWIILVPIVMKLSQTSDGESGGISIEGTLTLIVIAAWLVYPPYVLPLSVVLFVALLRRINFRIDHRIGSALMWARDRYWWVALLSTLVSVAPAVILGRDSPALTFLLLDGSTWKPNMFTVLFWTFVAFLLVREARQETSADRFAAHLLMAHSGFVLGMSILVVSRGRHGFFTLPYYIQKMLWGAFFLALPVALASGLVWLQARLQRWDRATRMRTAVSGWLLVLLVPLSQGRLPSMATTHFSVDWFAAGAYAVPAHDDQQNAAFSMRDKLGSHMANLALRSASTSVLPPDVAISGNPYLACASASQLGVETIYTTPNGRAEMVESGCSPDLTYVEDGVVVPNPVLKFFGVTKDVEERTAKNQVGFRLLLRGFLPPEVWGVWAGGYRSAVGFAYESNLRDPRMEIRIRSNPKDEVQRVVVVRVNDEEVSRKIVPLAGSSTFEVPLPTGGAGTSVELTFTCERTSEEILADDPADGPEKCFGLETLTLRDGGAQ